MNQGSVHSKQVNILLIDDDDIDAKCISRAAMKLNITGSALAAELGVSRSAVWSFENSLKPKPETIVRAVNALKAIYEADKK